MTHDRAWTPLAHDKHDRARTAAGETEVGGGTAESEAGACSGGVSYGRWYTPYFLPRREGSTGDCALASR
jgi:hypothetical protein